MYRNAWSATSERLTGITRAMLDRDGLPPKEAIERFLDAVVGRDLLSDEPGFDDHWLRMLANAAAISLGGRKLGDARELIEQIGAKHGSEFERRESLRTEETKSPYAAGAKHGLEFDEPPRHRAEADARRLAMACARVIARVLATGGDTHTENPIETPT
jgi:DNA polymerase III epsilon subunit-like protein